MQRLSRQSDTLLDPWGGGGGVGKSVLFGTRLHPGARYHLVRHPLWMVGMTAPENTFGDWEAGKLVAADMTQLDRSFVGESSHMAGECQANCPLWART